MLVTIKISDIKIQGEDKTTPITNHTIFKQLTQILHKLDTGQPPKTHAERQTKKIYDSIKTHGWNPNRYGHIQAYKQGDDTILHSGNHRLAILAHLKHTHVTLDIQEKRHLHR